MNEEQPTTSTSGTPSGAGTGSSIPDELNRLGRQLAEAARLAWESDDRKKLQADLNDGLRRFTAQVDTAAHQVAEADTTKQVAEQAQRVATKVQETKVVDEVRDGLIVGLSSLNRELSKLLDRLAEKTPASTPAAPAASAAEVPPADSVPPSGPSDPAI
jgi:hypothetical protein